MNIVEKFISAIMGLILIYVLIQVGVTMFITMAQAAWNLSPISGIGFVVSVVYAAYKGTLTLRTMGLIFVGTLLSYAAGTLTPLLLNNILAGQFLAALIVLGLIIYLRTEATAMTR